MIRAAFVMCGHILKIFLNFSKCFSDAISQMLYNPDFDTYQRVKGSETA